MKNCLTPSQLLDFSIEPNWAWADPQQRNHLAIDLSAEPPLNVADSARLCAWVARQPMPIIGVREAPLDHTQSHRAEAHKRPAMDAGNAILPPRNMGSAEQSKSSISLAGEPPGSLADALDLIVANPAELRLVGEKIDKYPHACAVLVQVLRVVGKLGMTDALSVESLAYATLLGGSEFAAWLKRRQPRNTRASTGKKVVAVERRGDGLQIVLNNPERRNALCTAMRDALTEAFQLAVVDDSILNINVSANGPCFSAGGDLTEFGTMADLALGHQIRMTQMPARYLAACRELCTFRVQGACIGAGIELSAFGARLVATSDATFCLPEIGMGLIPGAGGCVSIPRRIGRQRTALLAIRGHTINADQALAWGLIDAIED